MTSRTYRDYKESDVSWIGRIPSHWSIHRLKYAVSLITEKTDQRTFPVALENIEGWSGRFLPTESDYEADGVAFEAGDILFGKLRPYLAKAYLSDRSGEAVGDFHVFRPTSMFSGRFGQYQILNRDFISVVDGSTYGAKMPRASWDFMGGLPIVLPPIDEQRIIASFLDRETAKIDTLVAEQEKLIGVLKEKRQSVISHAVTKGVDPKAPMKDSGVEWLGDIPVHWSMKKLKRVSPQLTVGIVVNPSEYIADEGLPFIYGGDISEGRIDTENCRRISPHDSIQNEKTKLQQGDIVTVRVGAPGVSAVVPAECDGGNCASVMLIRKGDFDSDWLCFSMNSRIVRYQVEIVQYGAAQEQFNIGHAVDFWIPTPPVPEQVQISDYLNKEVAAFEGLISAALNSIDLLRERRSALISAAVTGKIDVRGLANAEAA